MSGPECTYRVEDLVGKTVYVRTVTVAKVGVLVGVDARQLYLSPSADVIESGAFQRFFVGEIRSYAVVPTNQGPDVVMRGACVTLSPWPHKVPEEGGD